MRLLQICSGGVLIHAEELVIPAAKASQQHQAKLQGIGRRDVDENGSNSLGVVALFPLWHFWHSTKGHAAHSPKGEAATKHSCCSNPAVRRGRRPSRTDLILQGFRCLEDCPKYKGSMR